MSSIDDILTNQIQRNKHKTFGFANIFNGQLFLHNGMLCYEHIPSEQYYDCLTAAIELHRSLQQVAIPSVIAEGIDEQQLFSHHCFVEVDNEVLDSTGLYTPRGALHTKICTIPEEIIWAEKRTHYHEWASNEFLPIRAYRTGKNLLVNSIGISYEKDPQLSRLARSYARTKIVETPGITLQYVTCCTKHKATVTMPVKRTTKLLQLDCMLIRGDAEFLTDNLRFDIGVLEQAYHAIYSTLFEVS